jgi:type VII secretion system (Wss) protein YukD
MPDDKVLELTVETTRGTKSVSFDKTAKVADVIAEVVRLCGFSSGDKFDLFLKSDLQHPLQPERTLVSYHMTDGTVLVLSQVGSGV